MVTDLLFPYDAEASQEFDRQVQRTCARFDRVSQCLECAQGRYKRAAVLIEAATDSLRAAVIRRSL